MISVDRDLDYRPPHGRAMAAFLTNRYESFRVIEASSRKIFSPQFFAAEYPNGLDWVTVDGDHTYRGCLFDLEAVCSFVNTNGVIIVDDYSSGPPNGVKFDSVTRSVKTFLNKYQHEFTHDRWSNSGKGMCIIRKT